MRCKGGANQAYEPRAPPCPLLGSSISGRYLLTPSPGRAPLWPPLCRVPPLPAPGGAGSLHRLRSVFFLRLSLLVSRFSRCLSIAGERAGRCLLRFFRSPRAFWVRAVESCGFRTSFKAAPLCRCGPIGLPPIRAVCASVYGCVWCVSLCCGSLYGLRMAVRVSLWCLCACVGVCVCIYLCMSLVCVCVYMYVCLCGICLYAGESLYTRI